MFNSNQQQRYITRAIFIYCDKKWNQVHTEYFVFNVFNSKVGNHDAPV